MNCEVCKQPLMVLDQDDRNKPLRCSDSCAENRKSLADRKMVVDDGLTTAKRKKGLFSRK